LVYRSFERAAAGGESFEMRRPRERRETGEDAMEFTMDELREFLEGDSLDVQADPEFKERLRRKLWEMVRSRTARRSSDDEV
jgi:hypothetical protein